MLFYCHKSTTAPPTQRSPAQISPSHTAMIWLWNDWNCIDFTRCEHRILQPQLKVLGKFSPVFCNQHKDNIISISFKINYLLFYSVHWSWAWSVCDCRFKIPFADEKARILRPQSRSVIGRTPRPGRILSLPKSISTHVKLTFSVISSAWHCRRHQGWNQCLHRLHRNTAKPSAWLVNTGY